MKKLLLFLTFATTIFANETQLQKAQKLENQGKYKEAMHLYKAIALQKKTPLEQTIDTITQKQVQFIKKNLDPIEDKQTQSTIEQMLSSSFNIYAYKENYFLPISHTTKEYQGREQNEAKFQLSIKKPISYNLLGLHETINFGYTQTSWWQIYADSAPFRETNYQPEVFMMIPHKSLEKTALKAYKIGLIHESNGQGGSDSRSWNRLYLESYFQLSNLFITPKIWYRIPEKKEDDNNPDIDDYLGYGDVTLLYPYKEHTFKMLLRNNLKFNDDNKGYAELNWTFPFPKSKNTFGFVQLSSGYGDSLIDYDKEINRISFGISLSR